MNIQHGFENPAAFRGGYVSVGNFDGVHLGHQKMIAALAGHARQSGRPAVVLTFDPHPLELLVPNQAPPRLCSLDHKAELLAACGVDCLIVYPTDRELLELSPRQFFDGILIGELQAAGLVEGPNFCFGRNRAGNVETLRDFCSPAGLHLDIIAGVTLEGRLVSSSEIRKLIHAGQLDEAAKMIGRNYRISGIVAPGAARGLSLGFPTANLSNCTSMLPREGVYAGRGLVHNRQYPAAVHVGPNPTFDDRQQKTEVHLIGYDSGNLYGETVSVDLCNRLRDTMRFDSPEALRKQLTRDVQDAIRLHEAAAASPARSS